MLVFAVVGAGALVLFGASAPVPANVDFGRLLFWVVITFTAASLPVRLPGEVIAHITTAPILAAVFDSQLANPFAVCWVALLGTIELRDLRREPT